MRFADEMSGFIKQQRADLEEQGIVFLDKIIERIKNNTLTELSLNSFNLDMDFLYEPGKFDILLDQLNTLLRDNQLISKLRISNIKLTSPPIKKLYSALTQLASNQLNNLELFDSSTINKKCFLDFARDFDQYSPLELLTISGWSLASELTFEIIDYINNNPSLRSLTLRSIKPIKSTFAFLSTELADVIDAFSENNPLMLDLDNIYLNQPTLNAIIRLLTKQGNALHTFGLSGADYDDSKLKKILLVIKEHKTLKHLILKHVKISDSIRDVLEEVVRDNHTLETIDLTVSGLDQERALPLVNALNINSSLWKLDLRNYDIASDSAVHRKAIESIEVLKSAREVSNRRRVFLNAQLILYFFDRIEIPYPKDKCMIHQVETKEGYVDIEEPVTYIGLPQEIWLNIIEFLLALEFPQLSPKSCADITRKHLHFSNKLCSADAVLEAEDAEYCPVFYTYVSRFKDSLFETRRSSIELVKQLKQIPEEECCYDSAQPDQVLQGGEGFFERRRYFKELDERVLLACKLIKGAVNHPHLDYISMVHNIHHICQKFNVTLNRSVGNFLLPECS